jgi:bifunctional ADP-heptose synthase (sugar kinase/adenylyltransferase)
VDSRSKIVKPDRLPRPVTLVTGYFDVLRAEHARELREIRQRSAGRPLAVVVLSRAGEIMPQAARAELAAGLHMVDYVVTADSEDLNRLIESIKPAEVVRLEAADLHRASRLIDHVQRGQT